MTEQKQDDYYDLAQSWALESDARQSKSRRLAWIIAGVAAGVAALEALALGNVEVRPMISETYGIEDGVRALERAVAPEVLKVLLYM